MADIDLSNLASADSNELARLVKNASDAQLKEIMQGEQRGPVLKAIFDRLPSLFRADRAGATNAIVHWIIGDRPDGGSDTYEVIVADGTCVVSPTPEHEPKLALALGGPEFLKVISGAANPVMMFMTGKLKAKGDLGLAANIGNLFDMPKP